MRLSRRICIPTIGGFGNQLFTVAFAVQLSKLGHKVTLFSGVDKSQLKNHPTMFNVTKDLSGQLRGLNVAKGASGVMLRGVSKLLGLAVRMGMPLESLVQDMKNVSDIKINTRAVLIRGYFQNPAVLNDAADEIRQIVFSYGSIELPAISDGIIVHYRRGDYLKHGQSFGILADEYFLKCCQEARARGANNKVEIVSDGDPTALAKQLTREGFEVQIGDSSHLSPPELIKRLSSTNRHLVLSNSSLSWWAGALADGIHVYTPKTWFKSIWTCDMHLGEWHQLDSTWA